MWLAMWPPYDLVNPDAAWDQMWHCRLVLAVGEGWRMQREVRG